ncbi:3-hydroxyisobutyrate dehydrogenase-like protein [Annulohypoxylon moriforme]|nr:3-hydroxyisobutyrate dehydrogenase-like protein [Annulohypoxylon moriforme]
MLRFFSKTVSKMASPQDRIAFIGLGVMGYPMAKNLRKKIDRNQTLVICDVAKDALERFRSETREFGPVEIVANGYEALQSAETVITMLPSAEAVRDVYLNPQTGIFAAAKPIGSGDSKKLVIECGTIAQATIAGIFEESKKLNMTYIDAPVSGGPMGSEAGTLSFMVGCDVDIFQTVRKLLSFMGKEDSIFRCGGVGAGTAFKIINNYISIISVLNVSEALNIASKMNLDMKLLVDLINSSSGQCWVTSKNNPVPGIHLNAPASNGYEGGFRIELAGKVLGLGKELAEMVGAQTFLDKTALDAFGTAASDPRYAGKDARVVYKWLNEYETKAD